jgi:NAD-dependent deacetylase
MLNRAIVVLTGAGVSAESGLGTFRDKGGIWSTFDPMKLATPEAFAADPKTVHDFYNARRRQLLEAEPNAAHYALAELEEKVVAAGGSFTLISQNIDNLHERAGSKHVLSMHGQLLKVRCGSGELGAHGGAELAGCGWLGHWEEDVTTLTPCPACGQIGTLRPHVVWFGEMPVYMDKIFPLLGAADLFAAVGTSGAVYPAAGFADIAGQAGAHCVEINLDPSDTTDLFDEHHHGPATEVVPAWVESLISSH